MTLRDYYLSPVEKDSTGVSSGCFHQANDSSIANVWSLWKRIVVVLWGVSLNMLATIRLFMRCVNDDASLVSRMSYVVFFALPHGLTVMAEISLTVEVKKRGRRP